MGTAIALMVMLIGMLVVAGTPTGTLLSAMTIAGALGTIAIWMEPYRRARFFAFLDPWHDAQGTGFQIVQAMIGMGSGGIFGVGLGQGVQKIFYLPEAHTDMMLANIGEELGLVGVLAVVAAYALFAYVGFNIAMRCNDPFGKRLATGLTVLICGQAAINMLAVMGTAPLTGIPLPFLSYGGSSLVVLLAGVGILLNIAQRGSAAAVSVSDRSRGTAGHVLPALAVADALTERSVLMTFARSPDRVEAWSRPGAGCSSTPFASTGSRAGRRLRLPARCCSPGCTASCRRILRRRRPDVVLGGGGFVAGPMVFAASTLGIPSALTEADAHLGLANGSPRPSPGGSSSRIRSRRATGGRRASSGGRSRRARGRCRRTRRARSSNCRRTGCC